MWRGLILLGLALVHTVPAAEHTAEIYELTRLDPASGRTVALRRFSSTLDDTLLTGGSLWVTTTLGNTTSLWRLDPRTLPARSDVRVPSSSRPIAAVGSCSRAWATSI
ncbi:MAG: hypothetical protein M3071_14660 [Actinomycetota bacterium]|nr:hypothetical protein [Actinomycetota bacterium]